jgi:hypothetical protein
VNGKSQDSRELPRSFRTVDIDANMDPVTHRDHVGCFETVKGNWMVLVDVFYSYYLHCLYYQYLNYMSD